MKEVTDICRSLVSRVSPAICDKRVVLVGPSAHIVGNKLGNEIDSYDLVARINWQWPVSAAYQVDYGARTDLLFHCCNGDYDISSQLVSKDIPQIVFFENNIQAPKLLNYCSEYQISSYNLTCWWHRLRSEIGTFPFTGNVAADFLLATKPKELWIVGFSMHQSATVTGYNSDGAFAFQLHKELYDQPPKVIWKHDIELNCLHFNKIIESEQVRVDQFLCDIVSRRIGIFSKIKKNISVALQCISLWRELRFGNLRDKILQH